VGTEGEPEPAEAFDDGRELAPEPGALSDAERAVTVGALIRAELNGDGAGALLRAFAADSDPVGFAYAWNAAMATGGLGAWVVEDAGRRARAEELVVQVAPPDPSDGENAAALAEVSGFAAWEGCRYAVIVVPGFTPASATVPTEEIHPVAQRRLARAAQDFREGLAPFVLLSGGAVYPRRTPYCEALLMKRALLELGVPAERVLVDARARHTTTNLRNAGRLMLASGMGRAVITTLGGGLFGSDVFGQDFYLANPTLSTFHGRSERELGYRVGVLAGEGDHHIAFVPAGEVVRVNVLDALDP
jgi:hypothetical protein